MKRRTLLQSLPVVALLPAANWAAALAASNFARFAGLADSASSEKGTDSAMPTNSIVYELRVYHIMPGKSPELLARFRDHTVQLFARHGMKSVAYWTPIKEPEKSNTLIYILEHPSREAATTNWKAFQDDPEWKSVRDKSEEHGKLVEKIDSTFMALTDFSPRLR